jgi:hypothetical protein
MAVLLVVGIGNAFASTIPANSDLTGQFFYQHLLRTELLPHLQLRGWTHDWFSGVPVYHFYFPLPGLAAALLGWLLDPALALRIVALGAPVSLPWILYGLGRWTRMGPWPTAGIVLGGTAFLFTQSFFALGGNLYSTLAGEFSYAWGLGFGLLYLGRASQWAPSRSTMVGLGLVLTCAILSHVLPAGAAVMASIPLAFSATRRKAVVGSWVIAGLLTSFWSVPIALRLDQIGPREWRYVPGIGDWLPAELYLLIPAALLGAWWLRTRPGGRAILTLGLVGIAATVVPQDILARGRLMPLWFLAVHLLFGFALGTMLHRARSRSWLWAVAMVLLCLAPLTMVFSGRGFTWAREFSTNVLEGVAAKPGWQDLESLFAFLGNQPPGAVHWEDAEELHRFGGTYAPSLMPLFTHHTASSGWLVEASPLSVTLEGLNGRLAHSPHRYPYYVPPDDPPEWDPAAAVDELRLIGTRYLVTVSPQTTDVVLGLAGVDLLGQFGDLTLFDLGPVSRVVPLGCSVAAPPPGATLREVASAWIRDYRPGVPWLVENSARREIDGACPEGVPVQPVDAVEVGFQRVSFRTRSVGVPHLVRVSSFPNWSLTGGRGPYLAAPWFMIVIPDQETVTLRYGRTWAELMGWFITLAGVAGLVVRRKLFPRDVDHEP